MTTLIAAAPLAGLAAAAVAATLRGRPNLQRAVTFALTVALAAVGIALVGVTVADGPQAVHAGAFTAPYAIVLAVDVWSAVLIAVTGVVATAAVAFAAATGADRSAWFHPLVGVLLAGIALAFTTADLFNLFVAFEVMLIASYVLLVVVDPDRSAKPTTLYVAVNLVASTLLLVGIGLTYAEVGSVNLGVVADAAGRGADLTLPGLLLVAAFSAKAGLVPLHGWLPATYPHTNPAIAALFSGLLTKVGVYALFRVTSLAGAGDTHLQALLVVLAVATMLVGVTGAVGQPTMRRILSFHITSQVGYMIMGLAIGTPLAIAAAVAYTVHHIVVKTALFLTAGAVESAYGTGELAELGGIARNRPGLAATFGISASALAGLPPLSGFVPKFVLLYAAFTSGNVLLGAVSVVVSLLTLTSMLKMWNGAFWSPTSTTTARDATALAVPAGGAGPAEPVAPREVGDRRLRARHVAPAAALAAISIVLGAGSGALLEVGHAAADQLADPDGYIAVTTKADR